MFTDTDAKYGTFKSDVLCRMVSFILGTDDSYKWAEPKGTSTLAALKAAWITTLTAEMTERAENRQWDVENELADFRRFYPTAVIVDGKLDQIPFQAEERDALLLLAQVTPEHLLQVGNASAKAVQEILRAGLLFEAVDADDRFASKSLGETARKAFETETRAVLRSLKG